MITFRKIEPNDLPLLYQWENDAAAWADGANHNPLSQQDLRDYIATTSGDIYRDGQLRLIIQTENGMIGCVDLFDFDTRNRRAAIGLYIAPDFRGKGYGCQVIEQLEQYAFSFLNLRTIYAVIADHNIPCRMVFEKREFRPSTPLSQWTLEGDAILYIKNNANRI